MRTDRTLIASIVTVLAAVGASQGFDVSSGEQQQLIEAIAGAVAGVAAIVALGRTLVLRRRNRATSDFGLPKAGE